MLPPPLRIPLSNFRLVDKLWAGMPARVGVKRGQAVRLMTGCMIPSGADAVIRQEDTDLGVEIVQIFRPVASGKNICYRGEEYGTDALLLRRENRVDAASVAVAAGAGFTQLRVRRRARAVILTTGDEVRQPGTVLPAGKIYDSNTAYLSARLHQLGVETVAALTQEDDLTALSAALRRYAGEVDLILTTGGVSVGEKDLLEQAVKAAGAEVIFHGIDIKPGMPTLFAVLGNARLLGLSGNPFSAVVPFELLLRPMLAEMTGDPEPLLRADTAIAAQGFDKASPSPTVPPSLLQAGAGISPGSTVQRADAQHDRLQLPDRCARWQWGHPPRRSGPDPVAVRYV